MNHNASGIIPAMNKRTTQAAAFATLATSAAQALGLLYKPVSA